MAQARCEEYRLPWRERRRVIANSVFNGIQPTPSCYLAPFVLLVATREIRKFPELCECINSAPVGFFRVLLGSARLRARDHVFLNAMIFSRGNVFGMRISDGSKVFVDVFDKLLRINDC